MALPILFAGLALAAPAKATEKQQNYQIPAQSLNNALVKFALQSNLELIFTADLVRGLNAQALFGAMTPANAIARLLQNTGIGYRFLDAKTVTLQRQGQAASPVSSSPAEYKQAQLSPIKPAIKPTPMVLPKMLVTADLPKESPSYFVPETDSATKTATAIKSIPQSIHVISKNVSSDQQNVVLSETLNNVSGVIPRHVLYTPVIEGTLIRGFNSEQLLDGFTQYYNPGDRESNVNIEQIEILKGANSVFYSGGSGSPVGGVINLVSKRPKPDALNEIGVKVGSNNFYQTYLDVNRPLTSLAKFRVTGEYTNAGSYVDVVETQRYNINPSLLLSDNGRTSLLVQGKVSRWRQPEYQGLPAVGTVAGNFKIPKNTFIGPADIADSRSESNAVWASLAHQLNTVWTFNFKARYAQSEFTEKSQSIINLLGSIDQPYKAPATWNLINGHLFQEQEELSFLGNAVAKFTWGKTENTLLLGADHSQLDDKGFFDINYGPTGQGIGLVDLSQPSFTRPYADPGPGQNNYIVKNTSYGGYGQVQTSINKRLHFLASLRLGRVLTDYEKTTSNPLTAVTDKTKWLPKFGVVLDVLDELSLFAGYSEGMRGQPYARFLEAPSPEFSRQIEAGVKFDVAAQLSGQMAVYQIDRTNVAVSNPKDPGNSIAAGQQRSQGFEADVVWEPTEGFSVLANYAHTDARFLDNLAGVAAGNRRARVPEHSARLWANYRFQQELLKGFSIGSGVYVQSEAYVSDDNYFKTPAFHSFDAAIAYENKGFKLATSVKNLTNEHYFEAYGYLAGHVAPSAGTSVYATASMKF